MSAALLDTSVSNTGDGALSTAAITIFPPALPEDTTADVPLITILACIKSLGILSSTLSLEPLPFGLVIIIPNLDLWSSSFVPMVVFAALQVNSNASSDEEVLPNESTMRLTPEVAISQLEIILSLPAGNKSASIGCTDISIVVFKSVEAARITTAVPVVPLILPLST